MAEPAGTWLCPTPLHRERLLDKAKRAGRNRVHPQAELRLVRAA